MTYEVNPETTSLDNQNGSDATNRMTLGYVQYMAAFA
jgi:hypothetical protein